MLIIDYNYKTRGDGVVLKRTYSDSNHYIMTSTGIYYNEAIDVPTCPNIYFETPFRIDEYYITETGLKRIDSDEEPEPEEEPE